MPHLRPTEMMEIIRKQFYARNYHEIITPNMFNLKLCDRTVEVLAVLAVPDLDSAGS